MRSPQKIRPRLALVQLAALVAVQPRVHLGFVEEIFKRQETLRIFSASTGVDHVEFFGARSYCWVENLSISTNAQEVKPTIKDE